MWIRIALPILFTWALLQLDRSSIPELDEGFALRWVRQAALHPIRTLCASCLLVSAFAPDRRVFTNREAQASAAKAPPRPLLSEPPIHQTKGYPESIS